MTPIQERAWDMMLTAELNRLYWGKKAFWLKARLQFFQLSAAIIGCAAFASLVLDLQFNLFNKLIALVAAILSLALSSFDLKGALSQVEETAQQYAVLSAKYEKLWNEVLLGYPEEDIKVALQGLIDEEISPRRSVKQLNRPTSFVSRCVHRRWISGSPPIPRNLLPGSSS